MATLTESSIMARKGIRYFIYFCIGLVILRFSFNVLKEVYKKAFPPAPIPPTVSYGKLPKLPFLDREKLDFNFTLETVDGGIPQFPDQLKVYFMPKISANLLSLDYAREKAQKMGFNTDAIEISDSIYRFSHRTSSAGLEMNIITGSFSISYDLASDPGPLFVRPPQPESAATTVKQFLNGATMLPPDLTGAIKHTFLKSQAGGFTTGLSVSDSSLVRVDLFRKDFEDMPTVTRDPKQGNVWFMVSGMRERGRDIIAGEYHYFPVDESQFATYPIKSGSAAWEEFNLGNYFLTSPGSNEAGSNIKIRRIYLAYFDPGLYTEFLQPIFVFEGDNDFTAYIPAVTNDYYGE